MTPSGYPRRDRLFSSTVAVGRHPAASQIRSLKLPAGDFH
jgi:hypothetical protein